jgi:hypothetical protein
MHRTHVANIMFVAILLLSASSYCGHSLAQAPANLFQRIPASFEINKGQFTDDVRYVAHTSAYKASIKSNELVLHTEPSKALATKIKEQRATAAELQAAQPVKLSFIGANTNAQATAEDVSTRRSHYMWGEGGNLKSIIDVPHYRRVRVANLYQGVDVVYYGAQADLEYDLVVQPGADTSRIKLKFDREATLDTEGNLVIGSGDGKIVHRKPVVYQQDQPIGSAKVAGAAASAKRSVVSRYAKNADGTFGIALGDYDRKAPLTIDPVISFVTQLGNGNKYAVGDGVADKSGRLILTGSTSSPSFPVVNTTPSTSPRGDNNSAAFVTRLNAAGTDIEFSTILFDVVPEAIQLDGSGNIYVAGAGSIGLPIMPGAFAPQFTVNSRYFFKLSADGRTLLASTYFGGYSDSGNTSTAVLGLAVNTAGEMAVLGQGLPITPTLGAFLTESKDTSGYHGRFLIKLDAMLRTAVFVTYMPLETIALTIDDAGNVYVGGKTSGLPVVSTPGVFQPTIRGLSDGFVTKFSPTGQVLASTFIGGDRDNACTAADDLSVDVVSGIAVGPSGAIYVAGLTSLSLTANAADIFESTPQFTDWNSLQIGGNLPNGRLMSLKGAFEGSRTFLAKLSSDLKSVIYSGSLVTSTTPLFMCNNNKEHENSARLQIDSNENVLLVASGGPKLYAPGSLVSAATRISSYLDRATGIYGSREYGQYVLAINAAGARTYASYVPDGKVLRDANSGDFYIIPTSKAAASTIANVLAADSGRVIKVKNPLATITVTADKLTLTSGGSLMLSATATNLPSGGTFVFRSASQEIGRVPASTATAIQSLANVAAGIQFYSVRYEHPSMPNPVASSSVMVTINQPEVCN